MSLNSTVKCPKKYYLHNNCINCSLSYLRCLMSNLLSRTVSSSHWHISEVVRESANNILRKLHLETPISFREYRPWMIVQRMTFLIDLNFVSVGSIVTYPWWNIVRQNRLYYPIVYQTFIVGVQLTTYADIINGNNILTRGSRANLVSRCIPRYFVQLVYVIIAVPKYVW